jgi:hypothetical protein
LVWSPCSLCRRLDRTRGRVLGCLSSRGAIRSPAQGRSPLHSRDYPPRSRDRWRDRMTSQLLHRLSRFSRAVSSQNECPVCAKEKCPVPCGAGGWSRSESRRARESVNACKVLHEVEEGYLKQGEARGRLRLTDRHVNKARVRCVLAFGDRFVLPPFCSIVRLTPRTFVKSATGQ